MTMKQYSAMNRESMPNIDVAWLKCTPSVELLDLEATNALCRFSASRRTDNSTDNASYSNKASTLLAEMQYPALQWLIIDT